MVKPHYLLLMRTLTSSLFKEDAHREEERELLIGFKGADSHSPPEDFALTPAAAQSACQSVLRAQSWGCLREGRDHSATTGEEILTEASGRSSDSHHLSLDWPWFSFWEHCSKLASPGVPKETENSDNCLSFPKWVLG